MEVFMASPRDRALQRFVEQNMLTLLFLMVVLVREVFAVFTEDSFPQRLPVSRPSVLIVEVLRIGSMEISTRKLWLKRRGRSKLGFRSGWSRAIQVLGLWLLIRKANLTSGIAVRGGSAGPSLLALPARDPWRFQCYFYVRLFWFGFVFPGPFCSLHGRYAPGGQLCSISGDDSDPVSSGKYIGTFVFTAPVAEPTVMSFTVPLDDCTIVATTLVVTSHSSSPECSGAARVFASRCRLVLVFLLVVLTILFGTV